ncbi:MAG: hypothetical protein HOV68_12680, partial [Streptomycetaceae bacterium]|nr:hypothetical protein [Streptomycetaceae bacterium]
LVASPASPGAPSRFEHALKATGFPVRGDALDLFARSQEGSWQYFKPFDIFLFLLPLMVVVLAGVLAFARAGGRSQRLVALSLGAALAPSALVFGGWDQERWAFLLVANFCVVLWFWLGDHGPEVLTPAHYCVVLVVLLMTVHVPLNFFDGYTPRPLTGRGVEQFYDFVRSGGFFATPTDGPT